MEQDGLFFVVTGSKDFDASRYFADNSVNVDISISNSIMKNSDGKMQVNLDPGISNILIITKLHQVRISDLKTLANSPLTPTPVSEALSHLMMLESENLSIMLRIISKAFSTNKTTILSEINPASSQYKIIYNEFIRQSHPLEPEIKNVGEEIGRYLHTR